MVGAAVPGGDAIVLVETPKLCPIIDNPHQNWGEFHWLAKPHCQMSDRPCHFYVVKENLTAATVKHVIMACPLLEGREHTQAPA